MYKFVFCIFFLSFFICEDPGWAEAKKSLPVLLDSLKVEAVTHWGDRVCIARRLDCGYELEVYRKNISKKLVRIYSVILDGIYHLDGTISEDFLVVYGSSAVATQMSLLRWDEKEQRVLKFDDSRFNGDSRLHPEIFRQPKGFQLLTYGNINDMGNEPDLSKWYANIHTFEKGMLVSVKKVPYLKRLEGVSKKIYP